MVVPRDCCAATGPREQESSLYDIATHFGIVSDVGKRRRSPSRRKRRFNRRVSRLELISSQRAPADSGDKECGVKTEIESQPEERRSGAASGSGGDAKPLSREQVLAAICKTGLRLGPPSGAHDPPGPSARDAAVSSR